MDLLITGIHGFVGSNLVNSLKGKLKIYGLDIVAPETDGVEHTYSWEDLNNGVIPCVDAIIHLAGIANDTNDMSQTDTYLRVNTDLTKKIFDYFSTDCRIKKFIFFSSAKAAAAHTYGEPLTEDVAPTPAGPYALSKVRAEEYILEHLRTTPEDYDGRRIFILRPSMIVGPGCKSNLRQLYKLVKSGVPWPLGAFENQRSLASIGNLVFVVEKLLSADVCSGVYNVADDEPVSTNELVEMMCSALGKRARVLRINRDVVKSLSRVGDILHLPFNSFILNKLTESYLVSNTKIKEALGISHMPVATRSTLIRTIQSFKID